MCVSTATPENSPDERKRLAGKAIFGNAQRSIDVHHHFEPSAKNVDGSAWSIARALAELDRNYVDTAIAYAGPIFDAEVAEGRRHARATNEWSAEQCRAHPGRFGLFASLPLLDPEGSLAEIAYALDVLGADGIGLSTHYDGRGLGDPLFRPVFEELDRRKAVVYVHPAMASCPSWIQPAYETELISPPWIEFPTNTARTIVSMWSAGLTRALPGIRFIFCHGGGVLPILLGRFAGFAQWTTVGSERLATIFPDGVYTEFAKLYFECAQAFAPETIAMLRAILPPEHLLFGTDYSYFPVSHAVEQFALLDLPPAVRSGIGGDNAAALLALRRG